MFKDWCYNNPFYKGKDRLRKVQKFPQYPQTIPPISQNLNAGSKSMGQSSGGNLLQLVFFSKLLSCVATVKIKRNEKVF